MHIHVQTHVHTLFTEAHKCTNTCAHTHTGSVLVTTSLRVSSGPRPVIGLCVTCESGALIYMPHSLFLILQITRIHQKVLFKANCRAAQWLYTLHYHEEEEKQTSSAPSTFSHFEESNTSRLYFGSKKNSLVFVWVMSVESSGNVPLGARHSAPRNRLHIYFMSV